LAVPQGGLWTALLFAVGKFFLVDAGKADTTSRHNQQAIGGNRRNPNRRFCQTSKKMKNKAAASFFF
jgi:hypothetical protein